MSVKENKILTDDVIAKESLLLLKNNLVFAKLVYRAYEKTFGKVGDTISLKLPFRTKTASGRTLVKQPMVDQTIPFKIDRQENFGLEYTMNDLTLDIERFSERYLKSGMIQIANVVDRSIAMTLKQAFHTSGTPGTRPGKYIDFANAAAKLTTYAVPQDGMRRAVLDPFTCASVSDEVTRLFKESMVEAAYKKGYKGSIAELVTYESNNIPKHTVGAYDGTLLVEGTTPITNGNTVTFDGAVSNIANFLNVGDVFTMEGVYGVNPQSYETTGLLHEFVVSEAVTTAAGAGTITFTPALNDGTATTTNDDGDTISLAAYQNVTVLPADDAPITISGDASKVYEQNYLFHKEAIALCMIDKDLPRSAVVKARVNDPISGLSLSMTQGYDIIEDAETTRIDVIWGAHMINAELAMRMYGAAVG
jgi:hypothetical protein